MGITPLRMNMLLTGQWAMAESVSTMRATSRSERWMAWARSALRPSPPARS